MQVKRRRFALIQIADQVLPDFDRLLSGTLAFTHATIADLLCAVTGERIRLQADELAALARLADQDWTDAEAFAVASGLGLARIRSLVARGALICDGDDADAARLRDGEAALEQIGWHPLAATYHRHTAWSGIEGDESKRDHSDQRHRERLQEMVRLHGLPPAHFVVRGQAAEEQLLPLDALEHSALFDLIRRRRTTRAYREQEWLALDDFSAVLAGPSVCSVASSWSRTSARCARAARPAAGCTRSRPIRWWPGSAASRPGSTITECLAARSVPTDGTQGPGSGPSWKAGTGGSESPCAAGSVPLARWLFLCPYR